MLYIPLFEIKNNNLILRYEFSCDLYGNIGKVLIFSREKSREKSDLETGIFQEN